MWCSKKFIHFHYTIIQVVTSNYWTHSCNNSYLSLTDTDLLHNDVVVNSLPRGKILNIDGSSKGGGPPPLLWKKWDLWNFVFKNYLKSRHTHPACTTSTISEKHTSIETLDTCTSSIFWILFQTRKTCFSLVFTDIAGKMA